MAEEQLILNPQLYKLHRLFFIGIVAFAAIIALSGLSMLIRGVEGAGIGLVGIGFAPLAIAHWFAAQGAKKGTTYGVVLSRIIGSLWLIGFPVGTALGIYTWSKTGYEKWVDGPPASAG